MSKQFYVTTPIYYANGEPHIGHFLTTTIADVLARYQRQRLGDENVYFTTGLDEHGTNVEKSGQKEGYTDETLIEYVDTRAKQWEHAFSTTKISYDYFVRTTATGHKEFVQNFIKKMIDRGDVYKGSYKGKYCYGCEKFLTLSDLNDEGICPLHRKDQVIEVEETNYFFKLSKYAPKVKELLKTNQILVKPENKRNEMIARIDSGLEDLSISRPKEKVSWGVAFPEDKEQTVYVWCDALINYLSSLEINDKDECLWEGVVHILGKDINWFHNVIWPAFLLSAGYDVHKNSFVHSFLTVSGQKISKSLGNTIAPSTLIKKYGVDGARYLVLTNVPYKNDADVTLTALDEKYNASLANGLGNLVARLTKLAENSALEFDLKFSKDTKTAKAIDTALNTYRTDKALEQIWEKISHIDKHINENEPWAIEDKKTLKETLQYELDSLAEIALLLEPFLPNTSDKIQNALNQRNISYLGGLFERIKS